MLLQELVKPVFIVLAFDDDKQELNLCCPSQQVSWAMQK